MMWRRLRPLGRGFGRALGTIGFVILLNFVLFRLLPGDPVRAAARDPRLGPEDSLRVVQILETVQGFPDGHAVIIPGRAGHPWPAAS